MTWMQRSGAWCSQFGPFVSEPDVQLGRTPELGEFRKDELNGLLHAFVGCVPVAAIAGEARSLDRKHRADTTVTG